MRCSTGKTSLCYLIFTKCNIYIAFCYCAWYDTDMKDIDIMKTWN